ASSRTSLEISSEESEEGVFAAGGLAGFGAGGISGAGSAGSPKTLELRTAGGECQTVRRVVQPVSINQSHGQLRGNRSSRRRPVRMIRPATASNRKRSRLGSHLRAGAAASNASVCIHAKIGRASCRERV